MAESIVRFLDSQMTSKGVVMVFPQDFYPKGLNLGYVQYGSFVEKLSALRPVAKVDSLGGRYLNPNLTPWWPTAGLPSLQGGSSQEFL